MKKKIIMLCSAVCIMACSMFVVASVKNDTSSPLIDSMVEALTNEENPTINNLHMKLWWVNEYFGGEAIICTYGGDDCCE